MLTITDADCALAAELGLLLVQQSVSTSNKQLAADPRATRVPETWTVNIARTRRPVGRLLFTDIDTLYASKFTLGISCIEETVAEALRWIAPITRHARTGQYDGTETIVRRFGSTFERPRALTECGAEAAAADYNPIEAKSALINSESGEMCPGCRAKLEARGTRNLSGLPARSGSSSPRQRSYIRHLLDEAARCGRPHLMDARTIDKMSSRSASATIDAIRTLKARNWKGNL